MQSPLILLARREDQNMEEIRTLIDSLDALVYVSDMQTYEVLYINNYGRKIWGDITGKTCYRVLQKGLKNPCPFCTNNQLLDRRGRPGEPVVWEFQNTITKRWYHCRDSAIIWEGRLVRLEIATDITTRKETEHKIEEIGRLKERLLGQEPLIEKLQDILNTTTGVFSLDLGCIWLFETEHAEKKSSLNLCIRSENYARPESIPATISLATRETDKSGSDPGDARENLQYYLIDWAEKEGMHALEPIPLTNGEGSVLGYIGYFKKRRIDHTDQQLLLNIALLASQVVISGKAQEAEARVEKKYRILIENLPQGVFLKDPAHRYTSCNSSFASFLNRTADEIVGMTDAEVLPSAVEAISREVEKRVAQSKKSEEVVHEFVMNGKFKWIESIRTPLTDANGDLCGILGTMHDITDLKLAQEELQCLYNEMEVRVEARTEELLQAQEAFQRANNKLNLMNSVTRHDILNQMTALYGYLELVHESVTDPTGLEYLRKAEESARIIQEQILFTRLYQNIGINAPVWQQVQKVVERVLSGIKTNTIEVSLSVKDFEVYADPLLEKVFYTLIDNSHRHGEQVSHIRIGECVQEDSLLIWYEDDGVGIPAEEKMRIFERGYGNNTGLGLFLAREILTITGFSIAENGRYGEGVRFEIRVPKEAYRRYCTD